MVGASDIFKNEQEARNEIEASEIQTSAIEVPAKAKQ
ncbi:uncharacterized protein G2W53_018803 [Senna tora]|uniref:Uncharacterized protein n=1 Tax=Senna tora TaxID=362788 RepID=A0A834U148_9FABA|nr:uncharacterized protein G2W53_018803 [Senna tora]